MAARANSPQEPTCGRRLARRFRGSNSATRGVAQPRAIRPHAAQRKNVRPPKLLFVPFKMITCPNATGPFISLLLKIHHVRPTIANLKQ